MTTHKIEDLITTKIYSSFQGIEADWLSFFKEQKDEIFKDKIYRKITTAIGANHQWINDQLLNQNAIEKEFRIHRDGTVYLDHYKDKVSSIFLDFSSNEKFSEEEQLLISSTYFNVVFDYFYISRNGIAKTKKELTNDLIPLFTSAFNVYIKSQLTVVDKAKHITTALLKYLPKELTITEDDIQLNWEKIEVDQLKNESETTCSVCLKNDFKNNEPRDFGKVKEEEFIVLYHLHENKLTKIVLFAKSLTLRERLVIDLSKQIAKINIITDNFIQIYLKGFSEPELIAFDDYHKALFFLNKMEA